MFCQDYSQTYSFFVAFFKLNIGEELFVLYLSGESAEKTENSAQPG